MSEQRRVALVTGGSSDIGRAIALELAACGHDVVVHYRARADAAREVALAAEAAGARALPVEADLDDEKAVEAMFRAVRERWPGGVEVLVNNAARRRDAPLVATRAADWDAVLATTARGAFLCMRAALADMTKRRFGRIVNVVSVAGTAGWAGQASYSAAKAAVVGLTKTVAREYGRYHVTCNAVAPGLIETSGVEDVRRDQRDAILARTTCARAGTPAEVAHAVAFFASPRASYVTGQVLAVDGGFSM